MPILGLPISENIGLQS